MKTIKFKKAKFSIINTSPNYFFINIENILNTFWEKFIEGRDNRVILIIIKVRNNDSNLYITITPIQIVHSTDYDKLRRFRINNLY